MSGAWNAGDRGCGAGANAGGREERPVGTGGKASPGGMWSGGGVETEAKADLVATVCWMPCVRTCASGRSGVWALWNAIGR